MAKLHIGVSGAGLTTKEARLKKAASIPYKLSQAVKKLSPVLSVINFLLNLAVLYVLFK